MSPVIVIDEARRPVVQVDGREARLQDKQYKLVRFLAARAGQCVPYEDIYQHLWGDIAVEVSQMNHQKSKLRDRFDEASPGRGGVVKIVPRQGMMLDLRPAEVAVI